MEIELTSIIADEEFNKGRGRLNDLDLRELRDSIATLGLQQPVVVTPREDKYLLLIGYRRFRVHELLNKSTIRAEIRDHISDAEAMAINLTENINRLNLNILQEARTLERMVELKTVGEIATLISKSVRWVKIRLKLLTLPSEVQSNVAAGFLTQSDIDDIALLPDRESRIQVGKSRATTKKRAMRAKRSGPKYTNKYYRPKVELSRMYQHLYLKIGDHILLNVLLWCHGDMTDYEFFEKLSHEFEEYDIPKEGSY